MSEWWLYICEKKGRFYIGITTNLKKRLKQHGSPKLLYKEGPFEKGTAAKRERQIKKWSRDKKLKLIEKGQESYGEFTLSLPKGVCPGEPEIFIGSHEAAFFLRCIALIYFNRRPQAAIILDQLTT